MKVLSLFSGIGAFEKALTNMGVNYELINYCEIDKYASKSYAAIHGVSESMNLGDITKVDTSKLPNDIDLLTYGFPCQDISLAGKQRGFEHDGERTRSGLFFEALRLIEDLRPKFAICENVKNLTGKKFTKEFQIVLESLEEAGYRNYWQVLNAKDYGIPQNRERVFIISIRNDIDKGYEFPKPYPLKLRLKDMLDKDVEDKYYLSKFNNPVLKENYVQWDNSGKGYTSQQDRGYYQDGLCPTLSHCNTSGDKAQVVLTDKAELTDPKIIVAGNTKSGGERSRIIDPRGVATSLTATDYKQPQQIIESSVLVKEATKLGYAEAYEGDSINLEQPNSKTRRGRVGKQVAQTLTTSPQQAVVEPFIVASRGRNPENLSDRTTGAPTVQVLEPNKQGISNTLTTVQKDNLVCEPVNPMPDGTCRTIKNQYYKTSQANYERTGSMGATGVNTGLRIRKLTPKECFRLMGFSDNDFHKAEKVNSNTQLYKQAGNSIVVDVIEELYEQLFSLYWDEVR